MQFQRRVVAEHDLGRILNRPPPRIHELLQEDLAEDAVRLLAEDGGEDDGDAVVRGLDVDGLFLPIMDRAHHPALLDALRCGFGGVAAHLLGEGRVLGEGLLEGGGHGVPLQQGDALDQVLLLLLRGRQLFEVHEDAEVVALLGRRDERAILPLQDLLRAILQELVEALDVDADEDLRFAGGGGDVEGDVVEVRDDLVDRGGCGAVAGSVCAGRESGRGGEKGLGILWREAVFEQALNQNVLIVEEQHGRTD